MADEPNNSQPTVDKDALEIGELIKAAGFGKNDVNALTESAVGLASIRNLIENNPKEFLSSLEKANPDAASKFHSALAQEYVDRYASQDGGDNDDGDKGAKANKTLENELKILREKIAGSEAREASREQAAAVAQVKARYDARVDDLFNQLPKDLALTKTQRDALRAKLNTDLAADPAAIERASKGNFVDVPKKMAEIIDSWTKDLKDAAEAEKQRREGVKRNAFGESLSGPNPFAVDLPKDFAESWDSTEEAFAKALEKFAE